MTAALLDIAAVSRHFGGVRAVDGVDATIATGEILGLIGPNGAGKTTLVNLVTGHVRPTAGSIRLADDAGNMAELVGRPVHRIAGLGIARTFQNLRLYGQLSAADNVVVGSHTRRHSDLVGALVPVGPARRGRAQALEHARALLRRVGLDPDRVGRQPAGTLAYGDQRRLEIARALALEPRLLLLDEPAAGMNRIEKDRLADLLRTLVAESSLTIVLIEHDLRLVTHVCTRVTVMDFGRKIFDGPPTDVANAPAVVTAYMGPSDRAQRMGSRERRSPRAPGSTPLLEVESLDVAYGAIRAVQGASLHVDEGEVVALIGANGAGKSTVLRTLSGLVRARGGRARFGEIDLLRSTPHRIVESGLVHVPEGREILGRLTVAENLALGTWRRRDKDAAARDVKAQLERFPVLGQRQALAASQLSGGEQQVLAIARALVGRPRLLVLDEPSLGLAPRLAEEVFDIVASLAEEGMTVLLVEQNAVRALQIATRAYVMETGRIVLSGPAGELLDDPQVQASYLGT